jgi:mono/diheme cytochrome c family protein
MRAILKLHWRRSLAGAAACVIAGLLAGCRQDMQNQPRYIPMRSAYDFYADGRSSRPLVRGTVARGLLDEDALFYTGMINGQPSPVLPFPVSEALIRRGQDRFNIYCAPCHSRLGDGNGMIPRRGFRHPPSFHTQSLRQAPVGHFFDVITNGFGSMPDYASQIPPRDRWAITAYIRALQLSEDATLNDVPAEDRAQLAVPPPPPPSAPGKAGVQGVEVPEEPGHLPRPTTPK